MNKEEPTERQKGESPQAYAAFREYLHNRIITEAYIAYMTNNPTVMTSEKAFLSWASKYHWVERSRLADIEDEMETRRQERKLIIGNARTMENVSLELMCKCLDNFDLRLKDMTPSELAKFMKIGVDISMKHTPTNPQVVVNVDNNASSSVDISDKVLKELGKKLSGDVDD